MEKDINKIKRRLLIKYPFFGNVIANIKFLESKECATLGTDGETVYYNKKFLKGLSENAQLFVMAHEVCHIAFDHIYRSEGKDKKIWNIATDAVVNALLKQDGLEIIEGGVDIPEAINYNAEQMYEKLLKEQQENKKQNEEQKQMKNHNKNQSGNQSENQSENQGENQVTNQGKNKQDNQGSSQEEIENKEKEQKQEENSISSQDDKNKHENEESNQQDIEHDKHEMWESAIEKKKQKEIEKSKNEGKQQDQNSKNDEDDKSKMDNVEQLREAIEKIKEEILENGEKEAFNQNKEQRKKELEELRKSLAKQSIGAGNTTDSIDRKIKNIGRAKPLVDWRRMLRDAIKFDIDWSYQNATIEDGIVTSHLEEIPRPETEIVLDTSGSVNATLLRNFLRECKNIVETSKVKVGCFDTKFYGFKELRKVEDIDKMKFKGGGGTNFNVAVNAFTRRVENKIIFTDGEASMPSKEMNVIWVVFGDKKINPKGGRVINITGEDLRKLYNLQISSRLKDDFER